MAPTPFPTSETAAAGSNQDFVLIVILLGVMLFFLVRSIGKFSGSGMKVSCCLGIHVRWSSRSFAPLKIIAVCITWFLLCAARNAKMQLAMRRVPSVGLPVLWQGEGN
jgi:hypothetical protein